MRSFEEGCGSASLVNKTNRSILTAGDVEHKRVLDGRRFVRVPVTEIKTPTARDIEEAAQLPVTSRRHSKRAKKKPES